ncbi:hypothetical protein G4Z16_18715 [Streptomyces bathyalis]|uniref:Uncharacterized protein n=1 Tax=Streptomyces bathyalis TaxID=2710756 RepID=A0A7T1T861_9ACTN|nr:hypothetical protein [Streptomyces bathyalis]QPP08098.1 hypothetical protein G4Z16_18715 [Streptomyces bathyalis]
MRMMLRALMDTEKSNKAIENGQMQKMMDALTDQLKPEAAYYSPHAGKRSCIMIFDMKESSQLPPIVEMLFQTMGAEVEIQPVMNREELHKGLAAIA